MSAEVGVNIKTTSGPGYRAQGRPGGYPDQPPQSRHFFIDEIHRLNRAIEEILYPAVEDYALDIIIGKGPGAKSLRLNLPKFTLIGATTRYALLPPLL